MLRPTRLLRSLLPALALGLAPAAAQQLLTEDAKVVPPDLQDDDQFGYTVAVDGDTLVATSGMAGTVSVYVKEPAGWSLEQVLGGQGDWYGFALDLQGDRLALSYPKWGIDDGLVHVWVRSGGAWTVEETLFSPVAGGYFGWSLDLDGERLIVGAPKADHHGYRAGATYVYAKTGPNWFLEQELIAGDMYPEGGFGGSVALDGDTALVGIPGPKTGTACVFRRGVASWAEEARLRHPGALMGGGFGMQVELEGDLAVVAEPYTSAVLPGAGQVHTFRRTGSTWAPGQRLSPPDPRINHQWGFNIELLGGMLAVAPRYEPTVHVYEERAFGWELVAHLAPAVAWTTFWEQDVALAPERVVIGNRYEPEGAHQGGAVRVYDRPFAPLAQVHCIGDGSVGPCPCKNASDIGALAGCRHSCDAGAQLAAGGSASLAADDLTLFARYTPPGQPVLLMAAPALAPAAPSGDGLLCLGGGSVRLGARGWLDLAWGPGLGALGGFQVGETWAFQAIYRDPAGPCGTGVDWTNALAVTVDP